MEIKQFKNCQILRDHRIFTEDLWVRNGKIIDPEKLFFDEKLSAHEQIDCGHNIIAPGFIDLQINGGFGYDFSQITDDVAKGVAYVGQGLLKHGVTAFCPTLVTSPPHVYHQVLPCIRAKRGGPHGATILGVHLEGPFINVEKKGAHPPHYIATMENGFNSILDMYGPLDNVKIITLAPELAKSAEVIEKLTALNIVVSVGHSMANLSEGEQAVAHGATLITHLFNAMLPFHHRDPGLVGLLASDALPPNKIVYFGLIADGIHTHPAAIRIAHRIHPNGLVLVTDAVSGLGLAAGKHNIGQFSIEIHDGKAYVAGTNTLCGSIISMIDSVRLFYKVTGCSKEYALEAASLHPARVLGIDRQKGSLAFGADADFLILDRDLRLKSTWIGGQCVYKEF